MIRALCVRSLACARDDAHCKARDLIWVILTAVEARCVIFMKLAREGYDPVYGARPLKRAIQHLLLDPLSINILEGKFGEGQTIVADAKNGRIEFKLN